MGTRTRGPAAAVAGRSSLRQRRHDARRRRRARGGRMITLRELERSDVKAINGWRQDRSLTAGLGAPHRHIGIEVDDRWFETYLQRRGTDVRCAICRDGGPEPIGLVSLTGLDPV